MPKACNPSNQASRHQECSIWPNSAVFDPRQICSTIFCFFRLLLRRQSNYAISCQKWTCDWLKISCPLFARFLLYQTKITQSWSSLERVLNETSEEFALFTCFVEGCNLRKLHKDTISNSFCFKLRFVARKAWWQDRADTHVQALNARPPKDHSRSKSLRSVRSAVGL